jgi:hypothetical protein
MKRMGRNRCAKCVLNPARRRANARVCYLRDNAEAIGHMRARIQRDKLHAIAMRATRAPGPLERAVGRSLARAGSPEAGGGPPVTPFLPEESLGPGPYLTMPLPIPPRDEQNSVAHILDAADAALDRTGAAVKKARACFWGPSASASGRISHMQD